MKTRLLLTFLLLFATFLVGQVKIIISEVPEDTPQNAKIYMASSLNNWNPEDEKFLLYKNENKQYELKLDSLASGFEYKFTLGSWEKSEGDEHGNSIENRKSPISGKNLTLTHKIKSWQQPNTKKSTASKNVQVLKKTFGSVPFDKNRTIWIYLPENYSKTKKKYPVIYMLDGQNLFDDLTSFSGEWRIDETFDQFYKEGKLQAIVVGINNAGENRLNEYAPWKNEKYGGGSGDQFINFIISDLKPYIDKKYRTLSNSKNTALFGSSMGGLISLYAGVKYPSIFGKIGIFSPAFWFAKEDLVQFIKNEKSKLIKSKFYFLAGEKESEAMVSDAKEIAELLKQKKVPSSQIFSKFDKDGTHSEYYWAREFPSAIQWLFLN